MEKMGEIDRAIETYEKLLKLDSSYEDILPELENQKTTIHSEKIKD